MSQNTLARDNILRMPENLFAETEYPYLQLVQALPAAVYTCDADGHILSYNKAAVVLWGREPELGKDLWCGSWRIFRVDGSPLSLEDCPMAISLKEGRPVTGEEIIVERPDGVRRNVLPHPRPIFDSSGRVVQAVNMLVDITEYKKHKQAVRESEEKYKLLAQNLEKQVEERTRELKKSNQELAKSNNELEQFAYVASHDLQEPLRKIQAFAELLEHNMQDENKVKYYIGKITDSSGRMMVLVKELLNFSRLSKPEESYDKVDLNDVLGDIKEEFELLIKDRQASIESTSLPAIEGISLHIHQLFHNLISNSLKFCNKDRKPVIHVSARKLTKDEVAVHQGLNPVLNYVEIEWADNGIGFSQQHAEQIFTLFQRLDHSRAYSGTGIGLALCKKIVTNHHGHIYAQAKENEGATFHIIFPETRERSEDFDS